MIPIVVWYTAELSKAWSEGSLAGKAGKSDQGVTIDQGVRVLDLRNFFI